MSLVFLSDKSTSKRNLFLMNIQNYKQEDDESGKRKIHGHTGEDDS